MIKVIAYTDGACQVQTEKGGWGVILLYGEVKKSFFGFENFTTNNRMELQAVIMALRKLKRPCQVELHTDSLYVKDGFEKWMPNWKNNGWKTSDRKPVKNKDLWVELDNEISRHEVLFHWVKGHSGDKYNEEVDYLAKSAIHFVGVREVEDEYGGYCND